MANEEVIGIEVTEAISRALARALAKAEQLPQLADFSLFARDQGKLARLDRASFEEAVQKSQEKRSRGWEGDEPERLVFRLFCEALEGKAKKRSAYGQIAAWQAENRATVLTPVPAVEALRGGYRPALHETAGAG